METSNIIDIRDVIARVEELEDELSPMEENDRFYFEEREELALLTALLDDLKGCGGDEDWRGDWYPLTLIQDFYFEEFAQEEAESLGLIKADIWWPYNCIDWERAAWELRSDYSSVEFDGETYWYR